MTIFILGAGVMQSPAIRAAKELGWKVVVADANAEAPGAALADRFFPVDLKDREGLVVSARETQAEFGLDGVFTAGTDFSSSVAYVAEALSLPGIPLETALRASDKLKMRMALAEAGVPSPRFASASSPEDPAIAAAGLGFPLVVKPADSMGARGCRAVRSVSELSAAIAAALPYSRSGRAIVEEYIEGPEFSIDALVDGEDIRIRGFADRHVFFEPYFVELGHTMPSSASEEVKAEVLRVFSDAVRVIGIRRGAAKGDMKYCLSRRSGMVGEIAARLSGGYMSGWTYPYASGIDLTTEALLLAVGQGFGTEPEDRRWFSAERAFISIPGTVASVEGLPLAEREPYVKNVFLRVAPGSKVVFPSNNVEKCGNVISQAPTRDEAVSAAESASRSLRVRLVPDDPDTEAFLHGEWSKEKDWPPIAFKAEGEAERALAALPEYVERTGGLVAPFALASEVKGRDWTGSLFSGSAELAIALERERGIRIGQQRTPCGRFWRALAFGGLQAALYVLDTEAARAALEMQPCRDAKKAGSR
jgi:biotin carboxylase